MLYAQLRPPLGVVFRKLAAQKESAVLEGHLMVDPVHMFIAIPHQIGGVTGGWFHQGHALACGSRTLPQLCGPELLGAGLLRLHRREGRDGDSGVYPSPGVGRPATRTAQTVGV